MEGGGGKSTNPIMAIGLWREESAGKQAFATIFIRLKLKFSDRQQYEYDLVPVPVPIPVPHST